jgi:hypothetical protein
LKVCLVNAQSLASFSHLLYIKNFLSNKCIDILAVTETWLQEMDTDDYCAILGYKFIRLDRVGKRGGGVGLYIKENYKYNLVYSTPPSFSNKPEFIIVEVKIFAVSILIVVLYRRPNGEGLDEFFNILSQFTAKYNHCIVCGDFNMNIKNTTRRIKQIIDNFADINLIHVPIWDTHHTATSDTTIDLCFVPSNVMIENKGKLPVPDLSMHDLLYFLYPLEVEHKTSPVQKFRNFSRVDNNILRGEAINIQWHGINLIANIDCQVESFVSILLSLWNRHAPLSTIDGRKFHSPWITSNIVQLIKQRNYARRSWNVKRSLDSWNKYKNLRNMVKNSIRESFKKFISDLISVKKCSAVLWKNLRNYGIVKDKKVLCTNNIAPNELVDSFTLCQNLSVISLNCICSFYNSLPKICTESFYFKYLSELEVKNSLFQIKTNATGHDNISCKMLKPIINILLPCLTKIFNDSLQRSLFPTQWKCSLITPIPKNSRPENVSDYRPISILSTLSKVLERLVFNQVTDFLTRNSLFDLLQSGFRRRHSTCTALLKISEDIRHSFGCNDVTIMVLLDFSKAFDSVNHQILLSKLVSLNFSRPVIDWFHSYLTGRKHCVKTDLGQSIWRDIECGVPQGSVLGPLLYSMYIYDIKKCFKFCNYHLYADDLQLYIRCKPSDINDSIKLINDDLCRLFKWCTDHCLKINPAKSQAIIFSKNEINHQLLDNIVINGEIVPFVGKVKNLGLLFDCGLSWTNQISAICQRIYFGLHRLYKFRAMTPIETRVRLVNTLLLPLFDYCIVICCNMDVAAINRLQVVQNNCLRYIFNIKRYEHITPYYCKLGWLKIRERIDMQILLYTHKILNGYAPPYLSSFLTVMGDVHCRVTRSHKFYLQAPGKQIPDKSFSVYAYRLWNNLQPSICNINNTSTFRKQIEAILLKRYLSAKL